MTIDFHNLDREQLQEINYQYFIKLKLHVSTHDKTTVIKKVRTGSGFQEIAIVIKQSIESDCVITWNVKEDDEIESFDMKSNPYVFFDRRGNCCMTEDNFICIASQGVKITSYDVVKLNEYDASA